MAIVPDSAHTSMMEQSFDIIEDINKLLSSGKYKEALQLPNDNKYTESFNDNCWDLVSLVIMKIEDDTIIVKPSLQHCCEELLLLIAEKAQPDEALLEYIEQVELAKNDAQFLITLTPLQHVLKKILSARERSLEWCLNSISTYIEGLSVPENKLEGKERVLLDSDVNFRRIVKVYSALPSFYQPFMQDLNQENLDKKLKRRKEIIAAFLISLLGKPLIYIDLDPENNSQSEARHCCTIIFQDICTLVGNIFKLLSNMGNLHKNVKKSVKPDIEDDASPFTHTEKINLTTLSALTYVALSNHFEVTSNAIPQVYAPEYVLHTCLFAVLHLISFPQLSPLTKGLELLKSLMLKLPSPVPYSTLSSINFEVLDALILISIHSSFETARKGAVNIIKSFVNKFDYQGRFIIVDYIFDKSNHSGMMGYVITLYKDTLDEVFKSTDSFPSFFTGEQFMKMVKKICHLPHGAESDLVDLADQVITVLNFLWYLMTKDKDNVTGIKDCIPFIEDDYLNNLRLGLNMSKAHYESTLMSMEEGNNEPKNEMDVDFTVSALRSGCRYTIPLSAVTTNNAIRKYSQNNHEANDNKIATIPIPQDENQYEEDIKSKIMENALNFVHKSGWSIDSISAGAEAIGYPGVAHGLFPNGGGDLVHYFNVRCNNELLDHMKSWPKKEQHQTKVPAEFLENAIMTRLLMIEPYKSTWPSAIALQALPSNVPNCLATLLSLVDDICYYSGDRSVDFNWYVRRVGLAGIYKTAELFYIADNSQESNATRNFIASRIRDAQLIQAALNMNPIATAPNTMTAAFVTAKNILGINTLK